MRLKILHTESSKGWGGQEIRILDESAGMIARGHRVELACNPDSEIARAAAERQIPVHAIDISRRNWSAIRSLAGVVDGVAPDVIVTHSSTDSWLAALMTLTRRSPGIVRLRHLSTEVAKGPPNRWLYGRVPAHVVTTGEAIRRMLIERLGLDPGRITSIPTGIDLNRFMPGDTGAARRRLSLPDDRPIVGIVATLRSWKGHRYLIEAMTDPRLGAARLVIVGDGPQAAALAALTEEHGLGDRVHLAGRQANVEDWLKAFDIFALPSTGNEGVPQAVMQAMATALPVVTTRVGAIAEVVSEQTGIFAAPHDAASLADGIAELIADPARARTLGTAGRIAAERQFGAGTMLMAMERVLNGAVKQRS